MGFLREKYSRTYFTGLHETGAKAHYGALGADEWRAGGIFAEIRAPIDQVELAGRRVLEIGFGRAESARYLLRDVGVAVYVGVDFSEAACELARETLAGIPDDNWALRCGDALEFLLEQNFDRCFDAVLMLDAIEHIPAAEIAQILPLLHNALVPGGHLIVDTPFYPVDEDYIAQGFEYVAPSASDLIPETRGMHCNKFTRNRLLREMRAAGFAVVGDKLFRKALSNPLGLPDDAGWSGLCEGPGGLPWAMPGGQILLPRRLFGTADTISFSLTCGRLRDYGTHLPEVGVTVCGAAAGTLRFGADGECQRFEVTLDAQGEDILIELDATAVVRDPGEFPARIARISDLRVAPAEQQAAAPAANEAPQASPGRTRRDKIEYVDGKAAAAMPRGPAVIHDEAIRVERVEVIDPATRRLVAALHAGKVVTLRCHLVAQRELASPGCRHAFMQPDGTCLYAQSSGAGALKPLFAGERAIVEFSFAACVPPGEYRLVLAAGDYAADGIWRDREKPATYALRIAAPDASCPQAGSEQGMRVSLRPPAPAQRDATLAARGPDAPVVRIGSSSFRVEPHWFWEQFCAGWEPETFAVIRRFIRSDRPFLDVGSWIGPTALIAAACGAPRIVAVEANPRTAAHLERTVALNPLLRSRVEIVNRCIHREPGMVQFGNADGSDATSSASSLRGLGFTVEAMPLGALMRQFAIERPCLIKIDIEGAEVYAAADLAELAARDDAAIYLSLHPPFWSQMGDPAELFAALARFRIEDAAGGELAIDELMARCMTDDPYPLWGTPMGNFFEIVLQPGKARG